MFQEHKKRKEPFDRFVDLSFHKERYHYVPVDSFSESFSSPILAEVNEEEIQNNVFEECRDSFLVFVNGIFVKKYSNFNKVDPSIIILPLSVATDKFSSFFSSRFETLLKKEQDPLACLNLALYEEGVFLYLPPKTVQKTPLQILHIYTESKALFSPRIHLFLGKESELSLCCKEVGSKGWINGALDIVLEERASLTLNTLFQEEEETLHTESVRAVLKPESQLDFLSVGFGKKLFRQDLYVNASKGSETSLKGAFLLKKSNEAHIHTCVDHKEKGASSSQKFKTVLDEKSRFSFAGKIYVRKEALETNAYQANNNLILSDLARAYSKPNLEIFADDVKASHGATVGRLNEEELFYLKAKGIPEKRAKKLLQEGFYKEIIDTLFLSQAKKEVLSYASTL